MGRRISKEFLHPSILEGVNSKIGNLDSLETDAKGNMVQAINELVEKLDNSAEIEAKEAEIAEGKELIANAVGEPLTAEESFDEMSNDINSLLSTFKTNMMNNGITVESSDRFKSLIDKIATMVEEGSGKGIQFAEGNIATMTAPTSYISSKTIEFNDIGFIPTLIFIETVNYGGIVSNIMTDAYTLSIHLNLTMNETNCILKINSETSVSYTIYDLKYYAIGVGEEDTTLRDSLASILTEEGVDVTEEDDMASLITKVDEEFSDKENEIDKIKPFSFISNITTSTYDCITFFILKDNGELIAGPSYFDASTGYGDNESTDKVMVVESDVKKIMYTGTNCTFIMKNDGSVWACGANRSCQLGLGTTDDTTKFTKVNATGIIHVNNLNDITIIVKNDGTVWGCGNTLTLYDCNALVGDSASSIDDEFRQLNIDNVKEAFQISDYGLYAIFALKNDNTLWVIGSYNGGTYNTFTKIMDL